MPFETADALYLNQTEVELNQMLSNEATVNGDAFVNTYTASIATTCARPRPTAGSSRSYRRHPPTRHTPTPTGKRPWPASWRRP